MAGADHGAERRKGKLWPSPIRTVVLLDIVVAVVAAYTFGWPPDPAVRNVVAMVLGLVAAGIVWYWFCWRSGYSRWIRTTAAASGFALLIGLVATVRIDGFSGNLVPRFRWAWQVPRDQKLQPAAAARGGAALDATTPYDFPQFLGPRRDGRLPNVQLVRTSATPRPVWRQPIGAGWCAFSAVNGFAVTMEQRGPNELVSCYEIPTGRLVWSHAISVRHETLMGGVGPRATPTIHSGRVLAMGATGILRCLEGSTGNLLWSHDVPAEFGLSPGEESKYVAWGRSNSPLVVDDLVVVPAGGPPGRCRSLVAYRLEDGQKVWEAGSDQISYSSPILARLQGRLQILVVNEAAVSGHDPKTGEVLWRFDWPGNSHGDANTSQPHVFADTVLVSKGYGAGLARFRISGRTGEKIYHNPRVLKTKLTSFIIHQTHAYGLSDGILECVDLETGQRRWKGGRFGHGQILLIGEYLLVLSERGELVMISASPNAYQEHLRFQALQGQTWNNLCFYEKYLLVRNAQEAACYEWDVSWQVTAPDRAQPVTNLLE